ERVGAAPARVGEADLAVQGPPAARAGDGGDGDPDEPGLGAEGPGAEPPLDRAMRPHVPGPAYRAPQRLAGLADGEVDLTPDGLGADVLVAAHAEPVVQEAGGRARRLPWSFGTPLQTGPAEPLPYNSKR